MPTIEPLFLGSQTGTIPVILSRLYRFTSYNPTDNENLSESSDATEMSESGSQSNRSSNILKIPNMGLQYLSLILPSSLCSLPSATLSRRLNKTLQYGLVFSTGPYHSAIQSPSDASSPYPPVLSSFTSLYLQI